MGGLPSSKYQLNHPHEPYQATENLAWLVDELLSFCLLKSQLDTTCKGDPNVLRFTYAHKCHGSCPHHRPQSATFLTHSQTDTIMWPYTAHLLKMSPSGSQSVVMFVQVCGFDFFPSIPRICKDLHDEISLTNRIFYNSLNI